MKYSIVIPVFNSGPKIATTIESLLQQVSVLKGEDSVHVIVADGASTDDTLDHVRAFDDPRIEIISEPDSGMYDALAKGFARVTDSDVTSYMPAGERYDRYTFEIVSMIFKKYGQIKWLTGRAVARNCYGHIHDGRLRHPYLRNLIDCGMYGTRLDAIQQESTLWRSSEDLLIDLEHLTTFKLAGDYFLWKSLAQKNELYVVNAHMGSFTFEGDQLSRQVPGAYRKEMRTIRRKPTVMERLHGLLLRQREKRIVPKYSAKRMVTFHLDTEEWVLNE
ncbi:putative glycosyl transferase [Roseovarius albus]|uniref:Putative glycosyl transferase n=1 Tax=Roseovarius albus TaxID=1247867 RepID=A0A1X7A203_9RHOB|nr:glycosyltransferase [Roseovarius albus]SLN67814.1 putative glycosyl transferase [Roseovarius albus]